MSNRKLRETTNVKELWLRQVARLRRMRDRYGDAWYDRQLMDMCRRFVAMTNKHDAALVRERNGEK